MNHKIYLHFGDVIFGVLSKVYILSLLQAAERKPRLCVRPSRQRYYIALLFRSTQPWAPARESSHGEQRMVNACGGI